MRVRLHSNRAQVLLHMENIAAHLGDAVLANLLEVLHSLDEYGRDHEAERIEHIVHLRLLQRPRQVLVNPVQVPVHIEHTVVRIRVQIARVARIILLLYEAHQMVEAMHPRFQIQQQERVAPPLVQIVQLLGELGQLTFGQRARQRLGILDHLLERVDNVLELNNQPVT